MTTEVIETTKTSLLESEQYYRNLYEYAPYSFLTISATDTSIQRCNESTYRLLGYEKGTIIGKKFFDLFANTSQNKPIVINIQKRLAQNEPIQNMEIQVQHQDNYPLWCNLSIEKVVDERSGDTDYRAILVDITERKDAEEKLLKSESQLRHIVEKNVDGILVVDTSGKVRFTNQRVESILKRKKDTLVGEMFGLPLTIEETSEVEIIVSAGKVKTVELRSVEIMWEQEPSFLVSLRDITEQKQTENKIKEYAENLESMVEQRTHELNRALYDTEAARDKIDGILKSIADGLIVTDIYDRISLMNRAAEDMLDVRLSDVIDRPIDFAIKDETLRDRVKQTLQKKVSGYEFDFEIPGNGAEHPRIMRGRTSVIQDREGKQSGIITIIHDVTHEREIDRMKTEFISTAAHELRTPLTSIQGFSEILMTRNDLKEEEREKFLSHINAQSVSLKSIINDLLDISRIESGKGFSLHMIPSNLSKIIEETVFNHQTESPKHTFDVIVPDEAVDVMIDREKMRQVLDNILSNAVKYSPDGGLIRATGNIVDKHYNVSIADQGMGMHPEEVNSIFDKFYRANASNTNIEGTGLGMSIVKYLVEAHDGTVWVDSEPGKGTTVSFKIPVRA